jgi:hypothetical protein
MVNWWSSPIHKANPGYTEFTAGSFHTGIAPAGYAAFAFALGVTAGLLIRRTLPAMAVTLSLVPGSAAAPPGAWVISSSQLTTPDGGASSSEPAGPCGAPPSPAAAQACNDYIESLHLRQTVTYQPASR